MAPTVRLNTRNILALRSDPGVLADLERRARNVASDAGSSGGEYVVHAELGGTRGAGGRRDRAAVVTGDWRARRNELKSRALTRAFQAARR